MVLQALNVWIEQILWMLDILLWIWFQWYCDFGFLARPPSLPSFILFCFILLFMKVPYISDVPHLMALYDTWRKNSFFNISILHYQIVFKYHLIKHNLINFLVISVAIQTSNVQPSQSAKKKKLCPCGWEIIQNSGQSSATKIKLGNDFCFCFCFCSGRDLKKTKYGHCFLFYFMKS